MSVAKSDKDSDEKRFNETLKRMLKTPPTPHDIKKPLPKEEEAASNKRDKREVSPRR